MCGMLPYADVGQVPATVVGGVVGCLCVDDVVGCRATYVATGHVRGTHVVRLRGVT